MAAAKASLSSGIVYLRSLFAGQGTESYVPGGTFSQAIANVGTDADTNEKDLFATVVPANTLAKDGDILELYAYGICAANANTKTVRVRFGAASFTVFSGAVNGSMWWVRVTIQRRSSGNQNLVAQGGFAASNSTATSTTIAVTDTAAIDFDVTGQNGTAAANDLILHGGYVRFYPAAA